MSAGSLFMMFDEILVVFAGPLAISDSLVSVRTVSRVSSVVFAEPLRGSAIGGVVLTIVKTRRYGVLRSSAYSLVDVRTAMRYIHILYT
jgi:hypothetical protein